MSAPATTPPAAPVDTGAYVRLRELLGAGEVTVLTGAGMSTASGIPDYRGPDGTRRVTPMQHAEFVRSPEGRRRYWARAYAGWRRFEAARPNVAHVALAQLERAGLVGGVVTQNVDGLHQAAGSRAVLELHGTLSRVGCLTCGEAYGREDVHGWLALANPGFDPRAGQVQPDGDVRLPEEVVSAFRPPRCLLCDGDALKPEVVFFGGSVPRPVVDRAYAMVEAARTLLVLGSSLQVMSGLRFVRRAAALGIPVALVTRGPSRGDALVDVRLDALLGDVLPLLVDDLL